MAEGTLGSAEAAAAAADDSPDEVASSSGSDSGDSLLSALSSGHDGDEQTVTPAELLEELLTAWSNEKLCPDLLPHRDDLVECVRDQLEGIERQLVRRNSSSRAPRELVGYLHKLEVSRVRYVVTDLLRSRLAKIQAFAEAMTAGAGGGGWAGRLSPAEGEFARDLVTSTHRHFDCLALGRMPQFLRPRPSPAEAPKPNLDAFVFFRVRGDGGDQSSSGRHVVRPAREAEAVELQPGEQHLMQYAAIEQLLMEDKVQLS